MNNIEKGKAILALKNKFPSVDINTAYNVYNQMQKGIISNFGVEDSLMRNDSKNTSESLWGARDSKPRRSMEKFMKSFNNFDRKIDKWKREDFAESADAMQPDDIDFPGHDVWSYDIDGAPYEPEYFVPDMPEDNDDIAEGFEKLKGVK